MSKEPFNIVESKDYEEANKKYQQINEFIIAGMNQMLWHSNSGNLQPMDSAKEYIINMYMKQNEKKMRTPQKKALFKNQLNSWFGYVFARCQFFCSKDESYLRNLEDKYMLDYPEFTKIEKTSPLIGTVIDLMQNSISDYIKKITTDEIIINKLALTPFNSLIDSLIQALKDLKKAAKENSARNKYTESE